MPRRSFLTWGEPALPQAAEVLADEHQDGGELGLGRLLVVIPGRRAGRRLTELLVLEAEDRGLVLTPPATTTLGALPEYLYEPDDPLADVATSRLQWAEALRSLPEDRLSIVFSDPPADDDLSGWMTLASAVGRLHREVSGEQCDFSEVARRAFDSVDLHG